jgi:hypothetical protein
VLLYAWAKGPPNFEQEAWVPYFIKRRTAVMFSILKFLLVSATVDLLVRSLCVNVGLQTDRSGGFRFHPTSGVVSWAQLNRRFC